MEGRTWASGSTSINNAELHGEKKSYQLHSLKNDDPTLLCWVLDYELNLKKTLILYFLIND